MFYRFGSVDMTVRKPLVIISGLVKELPTGDTISGASGGSGTTFVPLFSGTFSTTQTSYETIAEYYYDPADYSGSTVTLEAVLSTSNASAQADLLLLNRTDNSSINTLSSVSLAPEYLTDIASMHASAKLYSVRLKRTGGSSSDAVTCTMVRLRIV